MISVTNKSPAFSKRPIDNAVPMSEKPYWDKTIGFVDNFDTKQCDLNNDLCPDTEHGILGIYNAEDKMIFRPKKIEIFDTKGGVGKKVKASNILKAVEEAKKCRDLDYLGMSVNGDAEIDQDAFSKKNINRKNLQEKRENLLSCFDNKRKSIIKNLEQIVQKGTRVFLSAGNLGEGAFNIYGLAQGVENVGYLDLTRANKTPDGKSTTEHPHSAKNSLVTMNADSNIHIWAVTKNDTLAGYSLSEDKANKGVVDIPLSKISGHERIDYFAGENIEDFKASDDDYKKYTEFKKSGYKNQDKYEKQLNNKLFSLEFLTSDKEFFKHELLYISKISHKGKYIDGKSLLNIKNNIMTLIKTTATEEHRPEIPTLIFDTTTDGEIIYNPHTEGKPANVIEGSSYSVQAGMMQVANEDFLREQKGKQNKK